MAERFYCENLSADVVELSGQEAHHAIHVMRLCAGQTTELIDGAGTLCQAAVTAVTRKSLSLQITQRTYFERAANKRITVAAPAPKGERLKWMVEKLTEIGVDRFIPMGCERATVNPRQTKIDKLQTTIISACKQSGRTWFMHVEEPEPFSSVLQDASKRGERILIAHPADQPVRPRVCASSQDTTILIGPEGGFTEAEVQLAQDSGALLQSWPRNVLRTETAAIVFATLLLSGDEEL